MRTGRRELLKWVGATLGAAALPACSDDTSVDAAPGGPFLTEDEKKTLASLADVVIPPGDGHPGGAALGTVRYVERLCTALDPPAGSPPTLFAGGPYSGRNPFPTANGEPSKDVPPNDFGAFLAVDRATELAWRIEIYGSKAVAASLPAGALDENVVGVVEGLRDRIRAALAEARADTSPSPIDVWAGLRAETRDLLIELVHAAAFSNPEYGGNEGLAGWKLARYEGDRHPFGFSLYDASAGTYRELPDAPVSGPNPGPDPAPMDEETLAFVRGVVAALGGREVV